MKLPPFFDEDRMTVDAALERLLPAETTQPSSIHTAMRYSVFAGGKRIRPILCLETARIFANDVTPALHPACAIAVSLLDSLRLQLRIVGLFEVAIRRFRKGDEATRVGAVVFANGFGESLFVAAR